MRVLPEMGAPPAYNPFEILASYLTFDFRDSFQRLGASPHLCITAEMGVPVLGRAAYFRRMEIGWRDGVRIHTLDILILDGVWHAMDTSHSRLPSPRY